ncbi:hypothetical protein H1C71_001068 [Ictidomys tridecemlineatus]|nr:hypothetical protein H1C71_001068 [Ictidomys tridecemlineatus]
MSARAEPLEMGQHIVSAAGFPGERTAGSPPFSHLCLRLTFAFCSGTAQQEALASCGPLDLGLPGFGTPGRNLYPFYTVQPPESESRAVAPTCDPGSLDEAVERTGKRVGPLC